LFDDEAVGTSSVEDDDMRLIDPDNWVLSELVAVSVVLAFTTTTDADVLVSLVF
jgi:hypothetical protein